MHLGLPAALVLLGLAAMAADAASAEPEWHDATEFEVEGRGWTATEAPYDRLPAAAKPLVPEAVWHLSHDSAGLAVRFRTDAPSVAVRWDLLRESLAMPHMPATGVSGVDLYRRAKGGAWVFVGNGRPERFPVNEATFALGRPAGAGHELLLYLPLYNGVRRVEIGVPAGSSIGRAAARPVGRRRPVVFYGTSIVQGGCASRPGMAHVALVGRMLDRPVINLGFSGSGRMEPAVTALLAELDPAVYVVDCLWNVGDLPEPELASRIRALVRGIRSAHPATPILFVGQSFIEPSAHPTATSRAQARIVEALRAEGVQGLVLMGGEKLLGDDGDGTVDGCHPNDLGMQRQAAALAPVVGRLLR